MWIFTQTGFVSAVADLKDKNVMIVRSRDRLSLEPLAAQAGAEIHQTLNRDYAYRVFVSKQDLSLWLLDAIEDIDYNNYKSRVQATRGQEFTKALHNVWSDMLAVQETRPYSGLSRGTGRTSYWYDEELPEDWPDDHPFASAYPSKRRKNRKRNHV
jgi:hypothetical protein